MMEGDDTPCAPTNSTLLGSSRSIGQANRSGWFRGYTLPDGCQLPSGLGWATSTPVVAKIRASSTPELSPPPPEASSLKSRGTNNSPPLCLRELVLVSVSEYRAGTIKELPGA